MKEDTRFGSYIFDEERFTSFVHEIDLYCGLSRRDVGALETVSKQYDAAFDPLDVQMMALADFVNLSGLKLPAEDNLEEFTSEFAKAFGERESIEGAKSKLDELPVSPSQFIQNLARKKVEEAALIWVFALRAYSVCVKNLEMIDSERKQYHLNRVLMGWSRLTALAVTMVGICLEGREVQFAGTKVRIEVGKKLDGRVVRTILMYLPTYISGFVRADLGTQKLSQQLLRANVANNPAADLIRTGLLTSMKVDGFLNLVRKFIGVVHNDRYLLGAMGWLMRDIVLRFGFTAAEEHGFRQIIAEIAADREGVRGPQRNEFIARRTSELSKKKIVEALRE